MVRTVKLFKTSNLRKKRVKDPRCLYGQLTEVAYSLEVYLLDKDLFSFFKFVFPGPLSPCQGKQRQKQRRRE